MSREARLSEAVSAVLPQLADVTSELMRPSIVTSRDTLAGMTARIASRLIEADKTQAPRPHERQICECGHARFVHSPLVDPAEPCTHEWDGYKPCDCPRFVPKGS